VVAGVTGQPSAACGSRPRGPRKARWKARSPHRDFSVAGRHLLIEIERRQELAEHRSLADRLQTPAAGRDEGAFLDQIEHVAGAADRAIPVLLVERPGVAIDEPMPKDIFRRPR
jgi:hypothetical protein